MTLPEPMLSGELGDPTCAAPVSSSSRQALPGSVARLYRHKCNKACKRAHGSLLILQALSRSERESAPGIEWVSADLSSYQSTLKALEGVDVAVCLVHSMLPSTRLFQGSFQDTDLLLADNFSWACIATG